MSPPRVRPSPSFRRRRRALIGLAASAALLSIFTAGAQAALPVREANGVRVDRVKGELVVTFTKKAARLYRRVAGRVILVYCTDLGDPPEGFALYETSTGGGSVRAPKKRRPIRTGDATRGLDYCRVWLASRTVKRGRTRTRIGRKLIVSVPLTQDGAVHLDEERKAGALLRLLYNAGALAERRGSKDFPTPAEVVEAYRRAGPPAVVSLARPSETPPAGKLGYYSDGRQRAAAVMLSASGRRLLLEYEGDGIVRSNVLEYIYGERD